MPGHEGGEVERANASPRRRAAPAWLSLGAVIAAVVALLVLDLFLLRPPAQRSFITRNLECLGCHTDLIPRLSRASVHQPFLGQHCTSCHTAHGYERTAVLRPSPIGPRWLRVRLERIGLRGLWDLLAAIGLVPPQPKSAAATTTTGTGPASVLIASQEELCWTCHGNLAPERLEAFQHAPFAEGRCTSCHDPHASDSTPLLRRDTSDVCVSCHHIGNELLSAEVHLPFRERECVSCHEPHASSHAGLLTRSQRDLCFGCHTRTASLLSEAAQHEPFVNGRCTGCHRPHAAGFAPLLGAPQPDLCYGCHGGVRAEFARASRHPVPSRLICSECHRPHAAPVRGLLPVVQRQLCLGCHGSVGSELTRAVVHEPVSRGDCTQCHLPHGSQVAPLLTASDPTLCRRCHAGIPADPARSPPPFRSEQPPRPALGRVPPEPHLPQLGWRPIGVPDPIVTPGPRNAPSRRATSHRLSRCGQCHRAHASDYARLAVAPGDGLCLGCHARDVSHFGGSAHGGFACSRCHRPHRAAGSPLLVRSNPVLCLGCHPEYESGPRSHPSDPVHYDYLAKDPLTCTSTCHDPHGSGYKLMLRVPYETGGYGSDYICLICHTQVGLMY